MKTLYTITGLPGSGKSTAAHELREWGVYPVVSMGDAIRKQIDEYGTAYDGVWDAAQKLREEFGPEGAAYACLGDIAVGMAYENSPGVIVEGVRNQGEIALFSHMFNTSKVRTIAIETPYEKRCELFCKRGDYLEFHQGDEQLAKAEAERFMNIRTEREVDAGLREAMKNAEFVVHNDGDLGDLGVRMAVVDDVVNGEYELEELDNSEGVERRNL